MCQNFATVNSTLTNLAWYGRNVTYDLLFFYSTFLSLLTSLIDFFSLLTICLSLPISVCGNLRCVGMLGNVLGMLCNVPDMLFCKVLGVLHRRKTPYLLSYKLWSQGSSVPPSFNMCRHAWQLLGMLGNVLGRPRHALQHPRHGLQRPRYGLQRPRHACNILGVLGMLFCKVLGVPHRRKTPLLAVL